MLLKGKVLIALVFISMFLIVQRIELLSQTGVQLYLVQRTGRMSRFILHSGWYVRGDLVGIEIALRRDAKHSFACNCVAK